MSEQHWIGRYRIEAPIGDGAMANVFLAHDPIIGRAVAIKTLKPEYRGDTELVRRFLTEAHTAGMLSHSHIVTIYDVGEADGIPYIAMELVRGSPLDEILRNEGRLTVERVLGLGAQVAGALAYAHERGVVHRDVKPSNILICDQGRTAKLLDFGIARIEARGGELDAKRTLAGQVLGTPRYMSPEQAMGLPVDRRSDLFSLGAVLYEMMTGNPAFPGTGLATLAIQIAQQDPVPIHRQARECPRGLCFIIDKLLAKKPGDRFPDAARLVEALGREREVTTQEASGSSRALAFRFKLPLVLAATATVALTLSVGLVLDRQNAAMTDMAMTSGSSMTNFVARNAALKIADNAGLPAASQDWAPLQAFVETAGKDGSVRQIVIADDHGIVRAAGDRSLLGSRQQAQGDTVAITAEGIRFSRTVRYAGADFGQVYVVMDRAALDAAMTRTRALLAALSLFVIATVAIIAYFSARELSLPLRRLRTAIEAATAGNSTFRLSHRRKDELGRLFDAFNRLADEIEARSVGGPIGDALAALRTRIAPPDAALAPVSDAEAA